MIKLQYAYWRRRRYQKYSNLTTSDRKRKLADLLVMLLFLVSGHVLAMVLLEDMSIQGALWLTLTTITTVGYGDLSAVTVAGRTVTIVMLYIFGIFLLAQIAGEFIDFRMDRRDKMRLGLWRWSMKDHIVIINTPDTDGVRYLQRLVEQIRKSASLTGHPVQILSPDFPVGLPHELTSLGVVLHQGEPEGRAQLHEVDVEEAAFILVLAVDATDYRSDSATLDILDQLKQYDLKGHVIAECVQDENRSRLVAHGSNAVLRPVRAYPELLVRTMAAPGTEEILENLFQHQGVHPHRYAVDLPSQTWGRLAARIILAGLGTPLGFVSNSNQVITNPKADSDVQGKAIFILVNHDLIPDLSDVQQCVIALAKRRA